MGIELSVNVVFGQWDPLFNDNLMIIAHRLLGINIVRYFISS